MLREVLVSVLAMYVHGKKLKQCNREILALGLKKSYFVKLYCLNYYIQKDTLFIACK